MLDEKQLNQEVYYLLNLPRAIIFLTSLHKTHLFENYLKFDCLEVQYVPSLTKNRALERYRFALNYLGGYFLPLVFFQQVLSLEEVRLNFNWLENCQANVSMGSSLCSNVVGLFSLLSTLFQPVIL